MKINNATELSDFINARYAKLVPLVQQLPPYGSMPITISNKVSGWVTHQALPYVKQVEGVLLEPEAVHIVQNSDNFDFITHKLNQIAENLQGTGCLRGWRNEQIDVIGEGQLLATIERAATRALGLLTQAVHLNAWSPDGRMWVARRSDTKQNNPGMWDTLVGGLVSAGESPESSLLRESYEEAGLSENDLKHRKALDLSVRLHRRLPEGYQVEDLYVCDCVLDNNVQPKNMDGEVSKIKLLDTDTIIDMLEQDLFTYEAELSILEGLKQYALK